MLSLPEMYRPKTFDDVVGQDKIIAKLDRLRVRGLTGRAYWLSGISGGGKTTTARLIAAEVAGEWSTEEIDATGLLPSHIQDIEQKCQTLGMGEKTGRAYVVNESHGLRRDTVRQLLTTLERIPAHVVWIFTTTNSGQESLFEDMDDAHPLLSRCDDLPLARRGLGGTPARN